MNLRILSLLVLVALLGGLAACGSAPQGSEPLRIALLPILDALPLYVAEAEGYFAEAGVAVEFVAAASAAERDQLLQAGQVDGVITDLVALALYNRDAPRVVAVRYAMAPTPGHPQFRLLAAPASGVAAPSDLQGRQIGISEGTVIEYVTRRMLEAEGLAPGEIETLAVPKIPERMALLNSGELAAATLPEPLASLAIQQGAVVIVDDTRHPDFSVSIFAFRRAAIEERPAELRAFLAAVDRASAAVNADPARWGALLSERSLLPPALEDSYALPTYPRDGVPAEAHFAGVVAWLQESGRLDRAPVYADVVTAELLE